MKITNVHALEILDSRGNPTVRTIIELEDGSTHVSSVPSGASTGSHEAVELRDNDKARYNGKGVLTAVEHVNTTIKDAIIGKEADPKEIDRIMLALDGTDNKAKLGANAILSVSMAVCRAAAHAENKELWQYLHDYFFENRTPSFPQLMVNVINGGVHANWSFDFQEFMIVPNSTLPSESVRIASEIFHALGKKLKDKGLSTLVGDEGGFSPALTSNTDAFQEILEAGRTAGYENVKDYRIAIDAASTEFYENGEYHLRRNPEIIDAKDLTKYYSEIGQRFKILSFEDAFAEDDWEAHKIFTDMAERFQFITIGDDLFVTNPVRIKKGIEEKAANAVLIKVNQIGTMTETAEAITMTHEANWKTAISHRSGETEDSFIADLAYACGSEFIKTGSMSRSERLAKYNRLLEIENNL